MNRGRRCTGGAGGRSMEPIIDGLGAASDAVGAGGPREMVGLPGPTEAAGNG